MSDKAIASVARHDIFVDEKEEQRKLVLVYIIDELEGINVVAGL